MSIIFIDVAQSYHQTVSLLPDDLIPQNSTVKKNKRKKKKYITSEKFTIALLQCLFLYTRIDLVHIQSLIVTTHKNEIATKLPVH